MRLERIFDKTKHQLINQKKIILENQEHKGISFT